MLHEPANNGSLKTTVLKTDAHTMYLSLKIKMWNIPAENNICSQYVEHPVYGNKIFRKQL